MLEIKNESSKFLSGVFKLDFFSIKGKVTIAFFAMFMMTIAMAITTYVVVSKLLASQAELIDVYEPVQLAAEKLNVNNQHRIFLLSNKENSKGDNLSLALEESISLNTDFKSFTSKLHSEELVLALENIAVKQGKFDQQINDINSQINNPSFVLDASQLSGARDIAESVSLFQKAIQKRIVEIQTEINTTYIIGISLVGILLLIILGLCIMCGYDIVHSIQVRLKIVQDKVKEMSEGNLPEKIPATQDELNDTITGTNILIDNLSQVKRFAEDVGAGHFDSQVVVFNNEGLLGKSLAQMRRSLKDVAEKDKVRNWTTEGIAKFADILRQSNSNLEGLCYTVVCELIKYLDANQGALFLLDKQGDEEVLDMKACYAYGRQKFINKTVRIGEGMVGQVYLERESVLLTEIPQNYLNITSGLGGAQPRSIMIVPLMLNESVKGILELASFHVFRQQDLYLVEKIASSIASTVGSVRIAEETNRLLTESLMNGEQLQAQEEEMRQNMEEMQTIQEQMQRQAKEMSKTQESLVLEKSMFLVLMENMPDRLTYKDNDCKIIRVNSSKAVRFKEKPEEMIGKTDFDYFPTEHAQRAMDQEKELLRIGLPMMDIQEKVVFPDGEVMYNNTSSIPFKNEKGEIVGSFCMTKDITHTKITEAQVASQNKILHYFTSSMPMFSYKIDRKGVIKDFLLGNIEEAAFDTSQFVDALFSTKFPDIDEVISVNQTGEFFTVNNTIMVGGNKMTFKHHLLPDPIFQKAHWGFAILETD